MNPPSPVAASPPRYRKSVLLIDTRAVKRDVRAHVMRDRGLDVDCASLIPKARALWTLNRYDIVLMDFRNDSGHGMELYTEMKGTHPAQKMAFFVGKPRHWAYSPDAVLGDLPGTESAVPASAKALSLMLTHACDALPNRGGVREATLRILAARSMREIRKNPGTEPAFVFADAVLKHTSQPSRFDPVLTATNAIDPPKSMATFAAPPIVI
jgi:CheY-like chemotaxis protein